MEKNPCYVPTDTLYEEKREENGGKNQQTSIGGKDGPANMISTKRRKTTKRCFVGIIAAVVFISILSLSLVAVIVLAHLQIGNLQNKIETLEKKLNQTENTGLQLQTTQLNSLQSSVDTLNTDRDTAMVQLSSLQSSVNTLNTDRDTAMVQLSSLQSLVNTLNTDRDTAMVQLSSLQSSVNTLNTTTMVQLSSLQSSVNTLNTTTMVQLSSLQSSVNTLNTTTKVQLSSLQSSVNTLNTTTMVQLSSLQSSVNTLNTTTMVKLSSLQSSVNTLNTTTMAQLSSLQSSVGSPVNLNQSCNEETGSCEISASSSTHYWRTCRTTTLPINRTVSVHVIQVCYHCMNIHIQFHAFSVVDLAFGQGL